MTVESIGLAEAFASVGPRRMGGVPSQVDSILSGLADADAQALREALTERNVMKPDEYAITAADIGRILQSAGFDVKVDVIQRYRRGLAK